MELPAHLDYADPFIVEELLEGRGMRIIDHDAVQRAVSAAPGPVWSPVVELAEN
jgi:hypothetical protein